MSTIDMGIARLHAAPAAELLRAPLRDAPILKPRLDWLRKEFDLLLMASGKSSWLSETFRNHILGQVAIGAIGNVYFGLWITAAGTDHDASHGGTANEVSGGSYARVQKSNVTGNFATISGDAAKTNTTAITFTTASANWNASAAIPQVLVLDGNTATSADHVLLWGDLTTARSVLNGDTAQFAVGAFSWTEEVA